MIKIKKALNIICFTILIVVGFSTVAYSQYTKQYIITWEEDINSVQYLIQISTDPYFREEDKMVKEMLIEGTQLIVNLKLGTYYFRIAGVSKTGYVGNWSEVKRFTVSVPDLESVYYANEDFGELLMPEVENSIDDFPKGEYYDKLIPYDYDTIQIPIADLFGDVSPKLLINLYYHIAFQHYDHYLKYKELAEETDDAKESAEYLDKSRESLSNMLAYYREAEKINIKVFRGTYKIKIYTNTELGEYGVKEVEIITLKPSNLKIKYVPPYYHRLSNFFIDFIYKYIAKADKYYYKGMVNRASEIYKLVLLLDPYNEYVLSQLEMIDPDFDDE